MATTTEILTSSRASHVHDTTHHATSSDDEDNYSVTDCNDEESDEGAEEEEADDGDKEVWWWRRRSKTVAGGKVLDPRAKWVQEWNRVFLLVCAMGLFVDPLFFYALSVSDTCMCLFVDGWFAVTVTALRCMTDAFHLCNMWLHFKMGKRRHFGTGSAVAGNNPRLAALRYLKLKTGFFFDLFVILPLPQVYLILLLLLLSIRIVII